YVAEKTVGRSSTRRTTAPPFNPSRSLPSNELRAARTCAARAGEAPCTSTLCTANIDVTRARPYMPRAPSATASASTTDRPDGTRLSAVGARRCGSERALWLTAAQFAAPGTAPTSPPRSAREEAADALAPVDPPDRLREERRH